MMYDNYPYYYKRFLFYKLACNTEINNAIIIYDSKLDWIPEKKTLAGWADRVEILDYHELVRARIDFSKDHFLDDSIYFLRNRLKECLPRIDFIYAVWFHLSPFDKMILECLYDINPDSVVIQLEDGLHDYMYYLHGDLFPEPDIYKESHFVNTEYRKYFSKSLPPFDKRRFYYALTLPSLITREESQQIPILEVCDVERARDGEPLRDAVIIVPQTRQELLWLAELAAGPELDRYPRRMVSLNCLGFRYREIQVLPIAHLMRSARHIGVAPANDRAHRLLDLVREVDASLLSRIAVYDRDPTKAFVQKLHPYEEVQAAQHELFLVSSPLFGAEIAADLRARGVGDDILYHVEDEDLTYLGALARLPRTVSGSARAARTALAFVGEHVAHEFFNDPLLVDQGYTFFNSLVPMEFLPLESCCLLSGHSSVLFRKRWSRHGVEAIAVVPTDGCDVAHWKTPYRYSQAQVDAIADVMGRTGVRLVRRPYRTG